MKRLQSIEKYFNLKWDEKSWEKISWNNVIGIFFLQKKGIFQENIGDTFSHYKTPVLGTEILKKH